MFCSSDIGIISSMCVDLLLPFLGGTGGACSESLLTEAVGVGEGVAGLFLLSTGASSSLAADGEIVPPFVDLGRG